jgi:cytochrome oxidase Cu insertion factor (SCO1/SenC/PrrC family)
VPPGAPRAQSAAAAGSSSIAPRVLATLPEFALENEHAENTALSDLRGTVWIADFIFTRCAGTCPVITRRMAELEKELDASPSLRDVKLVSFSVDPDFDRPDVLRDYRRANGADAARWMFLTGTRENVRGLVRDGFKLPIGEQPDPKMPIVHTQNFMVVDRMGRIRGAYDALSEEGRKDLHEMLATVVKEPSTTDVYVPADAADPKWIAERRTAQASEKSIAAPHNFKFTDRIGSTGISFVDVNSVDIGKYYRATHYDHGTAVAAADVDGDGRLDLYFANQAGKNSLYRNLGGGRFEDITARAGVAVGDRASVGAAFADIDNDGDPDLFVTSVREGNILFRNDGGGKFTNITAQAGVEGTKGHSSGAVFFDYDGDGLVDLFVTNVGRYTRIDQPRRPDGLWVSFGDAFRRPSAPRAFGDVDSVPQPRERALRDVTVSSGLVHKAWSGEATPFDYDADGRPDLYVAAMQGHDEVWYNLGGGRFQNRGPSDVSGHPVGRDGCESPRLERRRTVRSVRHRHAHRHVERPAPRRRTQEARPENDVPAEVSRNRRQPYPRQRALHQTGQWPVQGSVRRGKC